ncbi:MAG: hypothetical protein IKG67_03030, partial [Parasporobacterium sp.]|nr:hypothetical protein [Parasporobacterium sp.]
RDSEKPSAARHSIPAAGAAAGSLPKKKGGGSWQSVIGIAIVVVIAAAIIVFRMVDYNLFSARTQLDVGLMEEFPWGTDLYDAEEILVEMGYDVENNGDVLTIHSDVNRKWEYSFHIFSMGSGVNMGTASLAKTDPDGKIYEKCLEELEYELGPGDYINESRVEFWYDDTEIALIRLDDYVQVTLIWYGAEDFGYDDMPRLY